MKKRLLIIGAGGFGREIAEYAAGMAPAHDWEPGGFLDDNPGALAGYRTRLQVLGDPLTFPLTPFDVLLCAIGDPSTKLRLCRKMRERGGRFISLIHPTALVGQDCILGEGCILAPFTALTTNVRLGDFVTLNCYSSAGHDATIGNGCTLNAHCDVTGAALLGEGVYMGSHACVLPRAKVGDYALIGAGSVVLRRVPPYISVLGVPAKAIAKRYHAAHG